MLLYKRMVFVFRENHPCFMLSTLFLLFAQPGEGEEGGQYQQTQRRECSDVGVDEEVGGPLREVRRGEGECLVVDYGV